MVSQKIEVQEMEVNPVDVPLAELRTQNYKYRQVWLEKCFQIKPLGLRETDPLDNVPAGIEFTNETVAEEETSRSLPGGSAGASCEINIADEDPEQCRTAEVTTANDAAKYYDTTLKPNPEVTGWTMESCAQGPYHNSSLYVGNSILVFAIAESAANGTGTVYGFRPTSLLTLGSTILGIFVALTCPLIGAVVDHTSYRRQIGGITAGILCLITTLQLAVLSPTRWAPTLILNICGGFFFHVHIAALLAYLPDLTHLERNISHYTSRFHMFRNGVTVVYYIIVTASTLPLKKDSLFTSRLALGVVLAIIVPLFCYPWIFLFQPRPALRPLPQGDSLVLTGFKQTYRTLINTWVHFPALRYFMLSLLLSPDAGSGTYLSIAVTFLVTTVRLTGSEMGVVSCIMILFGIPGSMLSKFVCKKWNAFLSFRSSMVFFSLTLIGTGLLMTGPERKNWSYLAAIFWGISFGWFTPSQRVLYCTLTPRGQEMEYMGFFTFCQMIVGWLPSFIFTVMNEAGIEQRYSMSFIGIYPLLSLAFSLGSGNYNKAVQHAGSFVRDTKRKSSKMTSQKDDNCPDGEKPGNTKVSTPPTSLETRECRDDFLPSNNE